MSLTVLNVAYPLAPVGRDATGGAEQVLAAVDEALVAAGHRSMVLACEGSRCQGELVAVARPTGTFDERAKAYARDATARAMARVLATRHVDLVHMHGVDFHHYLPPEGPPVLVTLHLPIAWYPEHVFRLARPNTFLHCVSAAQRRTAPPFARLLEDVPNGVPVHELRPRGHKERFALALGRICPEKGFHVALDVCAKAKVPLVLAGEVFPYEAHERYFAEGIAPRLGRWGRFVGPLDRPRKAHLLAAARCLVVPSLAPETSSLVAMEALACGTPVIAFRVGALADIVEHGITGLLVDDADEMVDAIATIDRRCHPATCRKAAEARFSADRMTAQYLALYARLTKEHRATPEAPWAT